MAVAEPTHHRGRPKRRTRIVPPAKNSGRVPKVEQSVPANMSMMVPPPKTKAKSSPCMKKVSKTVAEITLLDFIRKAAKRGEGSKGGHIIGHTKSGKPIYDHRQATHSVYRGFTGGEHKEAADYHHRVSDRYHDSSSELGDKLERLTGHVGYDDDTDRDAMYADEKKGQHHWRLGEGHARLAGVESSVKKHGPAALCASAHPLFRLRKAARRGEGSHGGHIIGHTRRGKPIYAAGHAHYENVHHVSGNDPYAQWHKDAIANSGRDLKDLFGDYRPSDHRDAADAHIQQAARFSALSDRAAAAKKAVDHRSVNQAKYASWKHEDIAQAHLAASGRSPSIVSGYGYQSPVSTLKLRSTQQAVASKVPGALEAAVRYNTRNLKGTTTANSAHDHEWMAEHHDRQKEAVRDEQELPGTSDAQFKMLQHDWDHHNSLATTHAHIAAKMKETPGWGLATDAVKKEGSFSTGLIHLRKTAKRGEGSHGGKVIGHTRSGKPVYEHRSSVHAGIKNPFPPTGPSDGGHKDWKTARSKNRKTIMATHPEFTAEDHDDAAKLHNAVSQRGKSRWKSERYPIGSRGFNRATEDHEMSGGVSAAHSEAADKMRAKQPLRPGEKWIGEGKNKVLMSPWPFMAHAHRRGL